MAVTVTPLQHISPIKIRRSRDNPRLIFREDEMYQLLESIRKQGVRVPVSVYTAGTKFTLIDGERRWLCAKRLNLKSIPAIVQPKPKRLENVLMMFNIHNVRVDWDLLPMALKLQEVCDMLARERKPHSHRDLAAITGVRLPTVKRAFDLLGMPKKYQDMLLKEAKKPKHEQVITADLFIEIYKSTNTIEKYTPSVFQAIPKRAYVDSMVRKYRKGFIKSVTSFRDVAKIARAERTGVDKTEAIPVIVKLVKNESYTIKQAFEDSVQSAYEQRDLLTKLSTIAEKLSAYRSGKSLTDQVHHALRELREQINRLLR